MPLVTRPLIQERKQEINVFQINWITNSPTFSDGSPAGTSIRNNANLLKQTTLSEIADYRPDPPAPTTAPTLSVTNLNCFGQNDLDWNSIDLANSYEVYRDTNSSFNNPVRIYNGLIPNLFVTYTSPAYYRVKACNEGGCSADSNQVTGQYINGCQ